MAQARTLPAATEVRFNRFLALVYMIMSLGMVITAWAATSVSNNAELMKRIMYNPWFAFGLFMLQIILVVALTAAVTRMSTGAALLDVPVLFSPDRRIALRDFHLLFPDHDRLYLLAGSGDVFL